MASAGSTSRATEDDDTWEVPLEKISLEEKVGSGCTAEVFRGFLDTGDGKVEVAIKEINWNKSTMGAKEQVAFDRELAILPRVSHENLVRFLGVASLQRPFRIMTEFCAGGCAFELLHNSEHIDLVWSQQHKMCLDVARAMDYLHSFQPQIIHRDLKSLNLLLAKPVLSDADVPFVKVSDFGLSRMRDSAEGDGWGGEMTIAAGTCHWMAPEVVTSSSYDEKVDVYSFSMIMFEVIAREIPFEDEEPSCVARLAVEGQRPDLEAVPPDCPGLLRDLMICSWAHAPQSRPGFDVIVPILDQISITLR